MGALLGENPIGRSEIGFKMLEELMSEEFRAVRSEMISAGVLE
jgi:hypothetical protein